MPFSSLYLPSKGNSYYLQLSLVTALDLAITLQPEGDAL